MSQKIVFALLTLVMVQTASARSLIHKTSFDETYDRYPSTYAVIEQFKVIVPNLPTNASKCLSVNPKSGPVMGVIDPLQGSALEKEPGDLFYQFYQDCVHELVDLGFAGGDMLFANSAMILGRLDAELRIDLILSCKQQKMYMPCSDDDAAKLALAWSSMPSKFITSPLRDRILSAFIDYLIGPDEVVRALGYMGENTVFGKPLQTRADLITFIKGTMPHLDEAPLSIIYADIAILLRLGPAIKS